MQEIASMVKWIWLVPSAPKNLPEAAVHWLPIVNMLLVDGSLLRTVMANSSVPTSWNSYGHHTDIMHNSHVTSIKNLHLFFIWKWLFGKRIAWTSRFPWTSHQHPHRHPHSRPKYTSMLIPKFEKHSLFADSWQNIHPFSTEIAGFQV